MAEKECGNKEESHPASDVINVKIVVMGEGRCGKTSFIRAFYNNHSPEEMYTENGVEVYPCKFNFNNKQLRIVFFEIPSGPGFSLEQRVGHNFHASFCVFMYAFDNPFSVETLQYRWFAESVAIVNSRNRPVVLVGNKKDLKNDPKLLARLADENLFPIRFEPFFLLFQRFISNSISLECCSHDVENVEEVFNDIFQFCIAN